MKRLNLFHFAVIEESVKYGLLLLRILSMEQYKPTLVTCWRRMRKPYILGRFVLMIWRRFSY